jgi:hypothetical protein
MSNLSKLVLLIIGFLSFQNVLIAQVQTPRESPRAEITQAVGDTTIKMFISSER